MGAVTGAIVGEKTVTRPTMKPPIKPIAAAGMMEPGPCSAAWRPVYAALAITRRSSTNDLRAIPGRVSTVPSCTLAALRRAMALRLYVGFVEAFMAMDRIEVAVPPHIPASRIGRICRRSAPVPRYIAFHEDP